MTPAKVSAPRALSRDASRLLAALGAGASARVDPLVPDMLSLERARGGVTLGGGRFRIAAGAELLGADLAVDRGDPGKPRLVVSEAGLSRLRRGGGADGFGDQHRDLVEARISREGESGMVRINAAENPLDWLRRRRDSDGQPLLDAAGYEAGQRLRRDLTIGQILPSLGANWNLLGGVPAAGGRHDPAAATDATIAARQRVANACRAVGADFADLLIDLCGFLKPLGMIERDRGWPPRAAKVVVRLALARLAEHYGLASAASGPAASRGIRIWRALPELAAPS